MDSEFLENCCNNEGQQFVLDGVEVHTVKKFESAMAQDKRQNCGLAEGKR